MKYPTFATLLAIAAILYLHAEQQPNAIISISNAAGDSSKTLFMGNTMNLDLTEKRGDKRLHIQDEKFNQNYTRSFIQSRNYQLTDSIDSFTKAVAEVYFCLQENGIETRTAFATKETTFEFIQKVIAENPGTDKAQKAIRMLLTVVATNTKRPTGPGGKPLHKSLNTNRANVLKGYYDDYDVSYAE